MTGTQFEVDYLAGVDRNIKRMKWLADRAMVVFVALRLGLVVGSASLPALTIGSDRSWSTVVAVGVAILAALDTQFRWGEEWHHFRSAQLTLERFRRDYDYGVMAVGQGRTAPDLQTRGDVFERLYQNVTRFLQAEAESFFKFRIVEWKQAQG